MKKNNKLLAFICAAATAASGLTLSMPYNVFADATKVVSIGNDLTDAQKKTMLKYFGIEGDQSVQRINVTNKDEISHLSSYIPLEQIGTRTVKLKIAGKTVYLPCVVSDKKAMANLLMHPERYGESYALGVDSFACDAAVLSYMAGYEEPKEYIMQNDIRIADRLVNTGHYEEIIKCLPLFQDCTIKLIDAITQNSDNTMLRAYLLEYMKEDKTDFDI